jgi:hypothetical protein
VAVPAMHQIYSTVMCFLYKSRKQQWDEIFLRLKNETVTSKYRYRYISSASDQPALSRTCSPRIGSGILGIFRLVPKSVVSKSGFRKAAPLSGPSLGPWTRDKRKAHQTKPNQTKPNQTPQDIHMFEVPVEQFGTIHIYWPGREELEMNAEHLCVSRYVSRYVCV